MVCAHLTIQICLMFASVLVRGGASRVLMKTSLWLSIPISVSSCARRCKSCTSLVVINSNLRWTHKAGTTDNCYIFIFRLLLQHCSWRDLHGWTLALICTHLMQICSKLESVLVRGDASLVLMRTSLWLSTPVGVGHKKPKQSTIVTLLSVTSTLLME